MNLARSGGNGAKSGLKLTKCRKKPDDRFAKTL
jgi:hypothetical protein